MEQILADGHIICLLAKFRLNLHSIPVEKCYTIRYRRYYQWRHEAYIEVEIIVHLNAKQHMLHVSLVNTHVYFLWWREYSLQPQWVDKRTLTSSAFAYVWTETTERYLHNTLLLYAYKKEKHLIEFCFIFFPILRRLCKSTKVYIEQNIWKDMGIFLIYHTYTELISYMS